MFAVRNQEGVACIAPVRATGKGGGQGNPRPVDAMDRVHSPTGLAHGCHGARLGAPTAGPRAHGVGRRQETCGNLSVQPRLYDRLVIDL